MNNVLQKNFDYFLKRDFEEFSEGEWVAIYNNKIVSHGLTLKKVIKEAENIAPLSKILISKIKKSASYL